MTVGGATRLEHCQMDSDGDGDVRRSRRPKRPAPCRGHLPGSTPPEYPRRRPRQRPRRESEAPSELAGCGVGHEGSRLVMSDVETYLAAGAASPTGMAPVAPRHISAFGGEIGAFDASEAMRASPESSSDSEPLADRHSRLKRLTGRDDGQPLWCGGRTLDGEQGAHRNEPCAESLHGTVRGAPRAEVEASHLFAGAVGCSEGQQQPVGGVRGARSIVEVTNGHGDGRRRSRAHQAGNTSRTSTGVRDGPALATDEQLAALSVKSSPPVPVSRDVHEAIRDAVRSRLWGDDMNEVTCAVCDRLVVASDADTHPLTGILLAQIVRKLKLPGDLPQLLREQYDCSGVLGLPELGGVGLSPRGVRCGINNVSSITSVLRLTVAKQ